MKAIRLDALASNTPAHKIYERLGFEFRGIISEPEKPENGADPASKT